LPVLEGRIYLFAKSEQQRIQVKHWYDYYLGNRGFAQELVAALKGEKVVVAEGADEPDDSQDPE
jgi:hypothetical protein